VRNWKEYNKALVNRGRIEFWLSEEAIEQWIERYRSGRRGKPKVFSNSAMETLVVLQQVFRMPLRQSVGFTASIFKTMSVSLPVPDYTTLCKRTRSLDVKIRVRSVHTEPLHIVVDGTGVKVYGEGEWKIRQHGWSKRRRWKKLHIGVDEKPGDILMGEVTGNEKTDGDVLPHLLDQLPGEALVDQVSADGAYDKRKCYDALRQRGVHHIAIPPQYNAKIWSYGNVRF